MISTQHAETVSNDELRAGILKHVIQAVIPAQLLDEDTKYHINPTGRFVIGGPRATPGLPGAKSSSTLTVAWDVTAAARSAARIRRRWIALRLTWRGTLRRILSRRNLRPCEVQFAYAIGVAEPVSVRVDTFGTEKVDPAVIPDLIRAHFKLTPRGIIESLDLRRPIYKKTAAYGHSGATIRTLPGKRPIRRRSWLAMLVCVSPRRASSWRKAGTGAFARKIPLLKLLGIPLLAKDARNGAPRQVTNL